MTPSSKIYVAGHRGLVGSAILRKLREQGFTRLITRSRAELNLLDQAAVASFFQAEKPEYVFLAAAKVGGIYANSTFPADFIHENLTIQTHVLHQSRQNGVKSLLFLGSSCIYPRLCPQPIKEEYLMTGPLEATNSAYAVAKIAGIEMCRACNRQYGTRFIPVMPTNLYGPNDNFNLETSHVLPAMIRKFHLARLAVEKDWEGIDQDESVFGPIPGDIRQAIAAVDPPSVVLWGTGTPFREFLHVDDLADACIFLMSRPLEDTGSLLVNIGTGTDLSIRDLAGEIAQVVGYSGKIVWDTTKPDGTPRKLLDVSFLKNLGWQPGISLREGLRRTYDWYRGKTCSSPSPSPLEP